jgi:hypothetical protein
LWLESARKDRTGDAPQPKPKHERENPENRIERESSSEKYRGYRLAFDHVDGAIERRREQGLPGVIVSEPANRKIKIAATGPRIGT